MAAARRLVLGAVTAVLAGALGAFVLYSTSVQPGAALVRSVFEKGALVTPPAGFAQIARAVAERRVSIPTPGAPPAYLDIYTPVTTGGEPRPVILWIHGGGFISSSPATVADYAILLAHAGYTVASLGYSLAPGARYPVPIRQGNAALRFLHVNASRFGGDPARIVLGGDSAGAQIASELAAVETGAVETGAVETGPVETGAVETGTGPADASLARSAGLTAAVPPGDLRGVVLFCGLYDMRTVGTTGFPALRTYLWAYTGVRDWTSYPAIDQLSTTRHARRDDQALTICRTPLRRIHRASAVGVA